MVRPEGAEGRWRAIAIHRSELVAIARHAGAGGDAEDVAQEALLRAAVFPDLDVDRAGAFLAVVTRNLVADLHRRAARDRALSRRAELSPGPDPSFEEEVCERDEARWAARLIARRMPADVVEVLNRRADGVSWLALAAERQVGVRALETRARRAALEIRRRVDLNGP